MKYTSFSVVAALALAACAGNPAGSGAAPETRFRMPRNIVGGYGILGTLALNLETTTRGDSTRLELFAHYAGQRRVHVRAGESLVLTVDGQTLRFQAVDADVYHDMFCDERGGPCLYDERVYYPATPAQVRAIAGARAVTVALVGSARTIEAEFNEVNFERFRAFVTRHVP